MLERLTSNDTPDIVIFYDGVSDLYAGTYSPAIPLHSQGVRARWSTNFCNGTAGLLMGIYNGSNYKPLFNKLNLWDDSIKSKIDENAIKVITNY